MYQTLFGSTTIPVLEQVAQFSEARHTVLAGNIANLDTPGYRVRDLSVDDFQARLGEAIQAKRQTPSRGTEPTPSSPGFFPESIAPQQKADALMADVVKNSKTILYHDDSNVGMEYQVTEMVKNQMRHNLALSIMASQFRLLEAAVSGRA